MTDIDFLKISLNKLAGIEPNIFKLSEEYWQVKEYKKGEFFNDYRQVCKHLSTCTQLLMA